MFFPNIKIKYSSADSHNFGKLRWQHPFEHCCNTDNWITAQQPHRVQSESKLHTSPVLIATGRNYIVSNT
jgi:hypothetical protein